MNDTDRPVPPPTTDPLTREDLLAASEAVAMFAGIDDGEYTDYDELMALAARLDAAAKTS